MELLAEGRMAEVFALDEDRVLKLDRPEWSGVSDFELDVINRVAAAGLPVAHAHGLMTVDGRKGVVLDRVDGGSLQAALAKRTTDERIAYFAARFDRLQQTINATAIEGLPDLVTRLGAELAQSGSAPDRELELTRLLTALDTGERHLCHFDFHPDNVLLGSGGWFVIDWLTAGSGPGVADLARTLVLRGQTADPSLRRFMQKVRAHGLRYRAIEETTLDAWVRVVAGARLAEGFDGAYADWLGQVADGAIRLFA